MQKWFDVTPDLVKIGDLVRFKDYDLRSTISLEVLRICPKTMLVMKFDKRKEIEHPVYVPFHKLGIVPREVKMEDDTPLPLKTIADIWKRLGAETEESGYFTIRAGFYFVYNLRLWFLYAPYYREGKYLPYVDTIEQQLRDAGATYVSFDEGDLD